jgi:hypothetical protein
MNATVIEKEETPMTRFPMRTLTLLLAAGAAPGRRPAGCGVDRYPRCRYVLLHSGPCPI